MTDYHVDAPDVLAWPLRKLLALTKRGQRRRAAEHRWLVEASAMALAEKPGERYSALMEALGLGGEAADGAAPKAEEMSEAQFTALGGRTKVVEKVTDGS